jgi:hypothetical protein
MLSLRAATRSTLASSTLSSARLSTAAAAARTRPHTLVPALRSFSATRTAFIENTRTRADGGPVEIPHHGVGVDKLTSMHL